MKCDGLTIYDDKWYDKSEADAAIAELKAKLETVNELVKTSKDLYDHTIESLKASHYTDSVDAGMRERRLRRALYKACANWAMSKSLLLHSQAVKFESYLPTKGAKLRRRSSRWFHCYEQCEAMAEELR